MKKPTKRKRTKPTNTAGVLDTLLRVIQQMWPTDPSAPGVVLSRLSNGKFYGSIVRYSERYGGEKSVVFKTQQETLAEVARALAQRLVDREDLVADLRRSIGGAR